MTNNNKLSENDTLYTDMVLEIMSSWVTGSMDVIETVTNSISSEVGDNETVMPGLLFGALLHMGVLLAQIAEQSGQEMDKVWSDYLLKYNTYIRKNMAQLPVLHPEFAKKLAEEMDEQEG